MSGRRRDEPAEPHVLTRDLPALRQNGPEYGYVSAAEWHVEASRQPQFPGCQVGHDALGEIAGRQMPRAVAPSRCSWHSSTGFTISRVVLTDRDYTRKCPFAADAAIDGVGVGRVESDLPQGYARNLLSTQARIVAQPSVGLEIS
jgi:hypothetical protein